MPNPYDGAVVLVNVDASHNGGNPYAPAVITRCIGNERVNVRLFYDTAPHLLGRHVPQHLEDVAFHDTSDPAVANKAGQYGAFWPPGPGAAILATILENQEKIMTAQQDIDTAVAAIQAVTADLTAAAANIQAEVANLNSELAAAGQAQVDTSALNAAIAPLQAAQAAVDALETPASSGTSSAAPAEPSAPAEGGSGETGTAGSTVVGAGDSGSAA